MKKSLLVKRIVRRTPDAITLYFDLPDPAFLYYPGQYVRVSAVVDRQEMTRTYSLSSTPFLDKELAITVKRIPNGQFSNYLVDHAEPAMAVTLEGPSGQFYTIPNPAHQRHLILFAAGSGITPLYSMIRSVLHTEAGSVISLIYANRSRESIIFRQELTRLQADFPDRFFVFHALDQYADLTDSELETISIKGSLSRLVIKKLVAQRQQASLLPTEFFLCGPEGFMQLIEQTLDTIGIPASQRLKEQFFVPNEDTTPRLDYSSLPTQSVEVILKGAAQPLMVSSGQSILTAALASGLSLPYSCRQGQCGMCRAQLIQGRVQMERNHILTPQELADGQVLLCQGFPLTNDVIVQPLQPKA